MKKQFAMVTGGGGIEKRVTKGDTPGSPRGGCKGEGKEINGNFKRGRWGTGGMKRKKPEDKWEGDLQDFLGY